MYNDETIESIKGIMEIAKINLLKDGYLAPAAFIFRANELLASEMVYFANEAEKIYNYAMVGAQARIQIADTVILINDIAMREVPVEKAQEFWDNFETERPLALPENKRIEGIMILHINVVTEEAHGFLQKYRKNEKDEIEFINEGCVIDGEIVMGELQGFILSGYKAGSEAIKIINKKG